MAVARIQVIGDKNGITPLKTKNAKNILTRNKILDIAISAKAMLGRL